MGKPISFLVDMGATYSVLPSFKGPLYPAKVSIVGAMGMPSNPLEMGPVACTFQSNPFTHSFQVMPSCPTPLLGRDLLCKLGASISLPPFEHLGSLIALVREGGLDDRNLGLPTPWTAVNPVVWDISTPVVANHHIPVLICLKDPSCFPSQPQFPILQAH